MPSFRSLNRTYCLSRVLLVAKSSKHRVGFKYASVRATCNQLIKQDITMNTGFHNIKGPKSNATIEIRNKKNRKTRSS